MIDRSHISLNRILFPAASLEEFFRFTSELGLNKIELRNDLPGKGIIDDYSPEQVKRLSEKYGITICTINALQKFNLGRILPDVLAELRELISLAVAIDCEAIVLVPNNEVNDARGPGVMMRETIAALKAFGPLFKENNLFGYVEPLGFEECSLRSKTDAMKAIQESGCGNYKIVHDTFHHHLGPDTRDTLKNAYDVAYTGLVHVSGVEHDIPAGEYRDNHRVLITARDKLKNLQQIEQLIALGYTGDISFEPFAGEVQLMQTEVLKSQIDESIGLLTHT